MAERAINVTVTGNASALIEALQQAAAAANQNLASIKASFAETAAAVSGYTRTLQDAVAAAGDRQIEAARRTSGQVASAQQAAARQAIHDAEQAAEEQIRAAEKVAQTEEAATREAYAAKKITLAQETTDLVAEEQRRFDAVMKALNDEVDYSNLTEKQLEKIWARMVEATTQDTRTIAEINGRAAAQTQRAWEQALQPVSQSFSRTITGMLAGTTTLKQGIANLAQSVITEMVDADVKRLTHWIATELAMTGATDAGNAARTASNTAARAGDAAGETLSTLGSITKHAASAAAAVYDDVAQIPVVGWILAPPAAAAAFVAVEAFGSSIPSLDVGAWGLSSDTMAQLHAGEMVIPADFASGLRGALAGGGSGGDTVINVNFTNNGGVTDALILQHSNTIARAVAKEIGNRNSHLWRAGR